MQSPIVIPESINQSTNGLGIRKLIPVLQSQLNMALPKPSTNRTTNLKSHGVVPMINDISTSAIKKVSDVKRTTKIPILKITINKKYNKPSTSNLDKNKHVSDVINNIEIVSKPEKSDTYKAIKSNLNNYAQNITTSPKPVVINLVPVVFEKSIKCKNIAMETKSTYTSKIAYTRKGDLSRDNSRNQTSAEKIRYLYTKAQRDCDILRIRLKALRERHKQEKEEIKILQTHLGNFCKNITEKPLNEMSTGHLKRKKSFVSLEDTEEEDEYEKLLREVRKIKEDILNPKYVVTASNRKLKQINVLNHTKNKINKECKRLMKNSISEVNVMKNREMIGELYSSDSEVNEDFCKQSHSIIEFGHNEIPNSNKNYLETVFMNT